MSRTSTATGWISQDKIMTYATPQIATDVPPTRDWEFAAHEAGLNWEPKVHQVFDYMGQPIEGYQAVAHGPDTLAVTSDRWRPILHTKHLRGVVETVVDVHGAPIDAFVVLNGGRTIMVRVTHGTKHLQFDPSPISAETWVRLRHDAKGALSVFENAQRTWCTNQFGGISSREGGLRVRHTGDVAVKVEDLVEHLRRGKSDWDLWEQEMGGLRDTPVRHSTFAQFVDLYIPKPLPPVSPARADAAQHRLTALWDTYSEELGKNAYAGLQAILEFEDKARTARGQASRFSRAIQPNPNKIKAARMLARMASR